MVKKFITGKIHSDTLNSMMDPKRMIEFSERFKKAGVQRVILFPRRSFVEDETRTEAVEIFRKAYEFFTAEGFEVVANICTIGFGETVERDWPKATLDAMRSFTLLTDFYGNTNLDAFCPSDEKFVASICSYLKDLAKTGVRIIMIDDDLCMNIRPGLGCACDKHLELFREKLGEDITREELQDKIFVGGPNKYRDVWMDLMGDTLRQFCRTMREAIDEVDPTIRFGQMCSYTNWDLEGVDALEIAKIMAGNTRPIMRLSGAPYWVSAFQRFGSLGMRLPQVIEFLRMQAAWCEGEDIEIIDENDNFPRPRQHCSASMTECVDLCLTASGGIGSLLHIFDCPDETFPPAEYHTVYEEAHARNIPVNQWMYDHFDGQAVGIRVYEAMNKAKKINFPEKFISQQAVMDTAFSPAQSMLANLTIPTQLTGKAPVGIAFGPNPWFMTEDERRTNLILDAEAAFAMIELGIDVGFKSWKPTRVPANEYFADERWNRAYYANGRYYEMDLNPNAEVLSWFSVGGHRYPAAYRYENADGQRFLVFTFDGYGIREDSDVFISYNRQKQLIDAAEWMGHRLPISVLGNVGLYAIARQDGEKLCVALCNMSEDWVWNPVVKLNRAYERFESYSNHAKLVNDELHFEEDFAPYSFICFTLE